MGEEVNLHKLPANFPLDPSPALLETSTIAWERECRQVSQGEVKHHRHYHVVQNLRADEERRGKEKVGSGGATRMSTHHSRWEGMRRYP